MSGVDLKETGVNEIDEILRRIWDASSSHHNSDEWNEEGRHPGKTYAAYIDEASAAAASAWLAMVKRCEAYRDALATISEQKKTDELKTATDVEYADFEQGYDDIIDIARNALKGDE